MEKYPEKENKEEKFKQSEIKEKTKVDQKKKYILENRHNYPYELQIRKFYKKFEPRNKEGSRHEIDESIINNPDFQYCKKHFIISEVK